MPAIVTHDSRSAVSRANFFLAKAVDAKADERIEFEAYLEAAIIFGRSAVHRFQAKYRQHEKWAEWWKSIEKDPHVLFFRNERNTLLKEASSKVGQRIWAPFIGPGGVTTPAYMPIYAREFYYFDQPVLATDTVGAHLNAVEALLTDAENLFT